MFENMLVVKVLRSDDRCVIKLAGPLTGSWTEDLRYALVRTSILEVDVRDVTFVDDEAEEELSRLRRMGATFQGEGRFVKRTCRRLHIPCLNRLAFSFGTPNHEGHVRRGLSKLKQMLTDSDL